MKHIKLTESQFREMREEYIGICLNCRAQSYEVEPDAENYTCDACDQEAVQGIENLLIVGTLVIVPDKE